MSRIDDLPLYVISEDNAELLKAYGVKVIVAVKEETQGIILECLESYEVEEIICVSDNCIHEMLNNQARDAESLSKRLDEIEKSYIRMIPKPAINVSFHLTDECNLNCKGCWHFAPLAKKGESFADVSEFERDIKRLAEVMCGEVTLISLFGGEPLLHPECYKFPYIVNKYLPNTYVELLTNGLLIPDQSENFWKSCRDNDVLVEWTRYPIKDDYNNLILNTLKEKEVKYRIFSGPDTKCLTHDVIDIEAIGVNGQRGRNDARYQWLHCFRAGDCVQLKKHRLYACDKAANAHIFKDFFNLDIKLSEFDSIDIYEAKNKDEITSFLAKPIPFCRYCKVDQTTEGHRWSASKKIIEEWT